MLHPGHCRHPRGLTFVELLVVLGVVATLVLLMIPAVQSARRSAARALCANNLRTIGLALHNYQSANEVLPMSCTRGEGHGNGHSALLALLPYMENNVLYNAYNFNLENSHDASLTVVRARIETFLCPENPNFKNASERELKASGFEGSRFFAKAHYGVNWGGGHDDWGKDFKNRQGVYRGVIMTVIDPDGMKEDADGIPLAHNVSLREITDGTDNTLAIVEKRDSLGWAIGGKGGSEFDVHLSPFDEGDDEIGRKVLTGSYHQDAVNVLFTNGTVRQIQPKLDRTLWYAMITRNGGELIDPASPGITKIERDQAPSPASRSVQTTKAAQRLFSAIKAQPPTPSNSGQALNISILDMKTGEVVLAASEPDPDFDQCGSPAWSQDGTRIVFDVRPADQPEKSRLKALQVVAGKVALTDLGLGRYPAISPVDDRVIFSMDAGPNSDAEAGVWLMDDQGSNRRRLGGEGRPRWSPDGHQFLIASFDSPIKVFLIDDRPLHASGELILPARLISVPNWADDELIVAVTSAEEVAGVESISLIETKESDKSAIVSELWRAQDGPPLTPSDPVYSSVTRQCIFVGMDEHGIIALYKIDAANPHIARRVEGIPTQRIIQDLAFSPDGRFLLFASSQGEPAK